MSEKRAVRENHVAELRELGFPEIVIEESVAAVSDGLFEIEPAPDLIKRTLERCQPIFDRVEKLSEQKGSANPEALEPDFNNLSTGIFALERATEEIGATLGRISAPAMSDAWAEVSRFERLPADCLATIDFARSKRERPFMIVDNHNLIEPAWWESDTGFRAMRNACKVVNTIAQNNGAPPALVVMVLREDINSYSENDVTAINNMLYTSTSDILMVPYRKAGEYKTQDVIVLGDKQVLKLEEKARNSGEAFNGFKIMQGINVASAQRAKIEEVAIRGIKIRHKGQLSDIARDVGSISSGRALLAGVASKTSKFGQEF